jgi:antitoxin ChpS
MIAVPPALLEALDLEPGAEVMLEAKGGKLVVSRVAKSAPSLDELLALCDPVSKLPRADKAWTSGARRGKELL